MSNKTIKSIAIISGKGGSGKTMIASVMAAILAVNRKRVLLIDSDMATGGLTYYLSDKYFTHEAPGFSEYVSSPVDSNVDVSISVKRKDSEYLHNIDLITLLAIGHNRTNDENIKLRLETLSTLFSSFQDVDYIIVDCVGGTNSTVLAVCGAVDAILLVAELSITSLETCHHLVGKLKEAKDVNNRPLSERLIACAINKVTENPAATIRIEGPHLLTRYCKAVPYDFNAAHSFAKGYFPDNDSLFLEHVRQLTDIIFHLDGVNQDKILLDHEFSKIGVKKRGWSEGILVFLFIWFFCLETLFLIYWYDRSWPVVLFWLALISSVLFLLSLADSIKVKLGCIFLSCQRQIVIFLSKFSS